MENLYKLSFENRELWLSIKEALNTGTEKEPKYPFYAFVEIGHVPIPATFDEQGNELTEASFHTDWAVDVMSKVEIPELTPYLIEAKTNYAHNIDGNFKIITK